MFVKVVNIGCVRTVRGSAFSDDEQIHSRVSSSGVLLNKGVDDMLMIFEINETKCCKVLYR